MKGGRQIEASKEILSAKNVPYMVAAPLLIQGPHILFCYSPSLLHTPLPSLPTFFQYYYPLSFSSSYPSSLSFCFLPSIRHHPRPPSNSSPTCRPSHPFPPFSSLLSLPSPGTDTASWIESGVQGLQTVVLYSLPELDGAIETMVLGEHIIHHLIYVSTTKFLFPLSDIIVYRLILFSGGLVDGDKIVVVPERVRRLADRLKVRTCVTHR